MKESDKEKVEEFWEWFTKNINHIKEVLSNDHHEGRKSLVKTMDNQVLQFGMFTWEMGPLDEQFYFLTISPNGNEELLGISKQIIEFSPNLPDWKFNYAKPAKEWDLKFSVFDDFMEEHRIDASSWNYLIERKSSNNINIIIEAGNLAHLDQETKMTAVDLVVTSLIGEAFKIYNIKSLQAVDFFDPQQISIGKKIHDLATEFEVGSQK